VTYVLSEGWAFQPQTARHDGGNVPPTAVHQRVSGSSPCVASSIPQRTCDAGAASVERMRDLRGGNDHGPTPTSEACTFSLKEPISGSGSSRDNGSSQRDPAPRYERETAHCRCLVCSRPLPCGGVRRKQGRGARINGAPERARLGRGAPTHFHGLTVRGGGMTRVGERESRGKSVRLRAHAKPCECASIESNGGVTRSEAAA